MLIKRGDTMDLQAILSAITQVGFPIVMVIGLCWFVYKIYENTTKENASNMEKVQARCLAREEKLYSQLEKAQQINGEAIATIAHYAEKLDVIKDDVEIIKQKVLSDN